MFWGKKSFLCEKKKGMNQAENVLAENIFIFTVYRCVLEFLIVVVVNDLGVYVLKGLCT